MTYPKIFLNKKGVIVIPPELLHRFVIKVPTSTHRLNGTGNIGLNYMQNAQLQEERDGVIYIDMTKKVYMIIPKEIVNKFFTGYGAMSGDPKAIHQYSAKSIYELGLVPVHTLTTEESNKPAQSEAAHNVMRRFK